MRVRALFTGYWLVIVIVIALWLVAFLCVKFARAPLWIELAAVIVQCLLLFHSFGIIARVYQYFVSGALLIGVGSFCVAMLRYFAPPYSDVLAPDDYQMIANMVLGLTTAAGACGLFEGMRKRRIQKRNRAA